ncbi:TetR/AcrR family transcriptional regulator [Oceanomicrobium pacificus]|uniref:TetR/AcrR family transcriptional regulator n=1 Tax=Oceanomicrobium pacificus TaxID=2692916 RepID=UPI002E2C6647|nr:TetR/AcrR family transcriptional regulator C-terminal domain-containing protein [Oceanomicrobium pacificus]
MRIADAEGLAKLSMRRLAQSLGVEAMSLYNHVRNKDDLLGAMVEHVASGFYRPDPEAADWKAEMHRRGIRAHDQMLRHPWSPPLIAGRVNDGPEMLGYVDATLGCLFAAGFDAADADDAWNAMDSYIYGYTQLALSFPFQPEEYAQVAAEYLPHLPKERLPHLYAMTEAVATYRHKGMHRFEFGFEMILDGLVQRRAGQG